MEYYAKFDEATLQHLADIMKSGLCTEPITLTQNGTYVAPVGKGYTPINVNVETGSSDFSIANVTVDMPSGVSVYFPCIVNDEDTSGFETYTPGTYQVIMYKGKAICGFGAEAVENYSWKLISGSATASKFLLEVNGDCSAEVIADLT